MALVPNIVDRGAAGDLFFRVVDLTLDNNYPAGGYPVSPAQLGFGTNGVIYQVQTPGVVGGFLLEWNSSTRKLMARDVSGAAGAATPELAGAATVLNGLVARLIAWGKGNG